MAIKASKRIETFPSGAIRGGDEKSRLDLLPPWALLRLGDHFREGAKHYGDRNWEKGMPLSRFYAAAMRHLLQWWGGQDDEDHLVAALWNVLCLLETEERVRKGILPEKLNDRPPRTL